MNTISVKNSSLLARYPVDAYIRLLDRQPNIFDYHDITSEIKNYCRAIVQCSDEQTLCIYHKLLLLKLIRDNAQKINTLSLPEEIKSLYCKNFARITENMSANDDGFYQYSEEKFCKDLALCRLKMIPVGAALLEQGRISRRFVFKKGLRQAFKGLSFIVWELKGFGPCYQLHLDSRPGSICLAEFNPDGWKRTFRRIAKLLKMRPTIKGVFGSTWFHDPALEAISPRLRFLNEVMVCHENRAALFYNGTSQKTIEDALFKSPTRRKLYEAGSYMPASYLVIWPRHKLIKWADSFVAT